MTIPFGVLAQGSSPSVKTLVIDAGHGGKDPGAVGKKSQEKDINLSVALKLGTLIKQSFPDVKVVYTRSEDKFIELVQRTKIANRNNADLFISIHCNAAKNTDARGVETFVMGMHKSENNLRVAQMENAAILKEQDYEKNYEHFDPNSPDAYIIFSMYQNAHFNQSITVAQKIQEQYKSVLKTPDRSVQQGPFWVLVGCTMPSVLTEIGFISNADEESFISSDSGQNTVAFALFNAFREYKYQIEGFGNQQTYTPQQQTKQPESAAVAVEQKPANTSIAQPAQKDNTSAPSTTDTPASTSATNTSTSANAGQPSTPATTSISDKVIFKVQFASSSINKPTNSPEFKALKNVSKYEENGIYKYCCGEESELSAAKDLLLRVQNSGFRDAFVVAFRSGKRISINEALKK